MARPTGPKVFWARPLTNAVPLLIGHTGFFGASQYFKGLIDEVEIFNRALLPSEILAIFDAGTERWTPSFGQVFVTAKVESGFMIQAAFGWPEVGRSPRLRSASSLVYASSGVRPLSDEWGRHRL